MKKRDYATLLMILAGCGILGWLGYGCMPGPIESPIPSLLPPKIELITPVEAGETVRVPLMLSNQTGHDTTFIAVHTSCSCSELIGRSGKRLTKDFVVPAHTSVAAEVTIDTTHRQGDHRVSLALVYQNHDREVAESCEFTVHVLPSLLAVEPLGAIRDSGASQDIKKTIFIGDAFEGKGIEVESVSCLATNLIEVELIPIPHALAFETDEDSPEWRKRFKKRYKIELSFDSASKEFSTIIHVKPMNPEVLALDIPVRYEGCRSTARLYPDRILLASSDWREEEVLRTIRLIAGELKPLKDLKASSLPDGVSVAITHEQYGEWNIECVIDMRMLDKKRDTILLEDVHTDTVIPIPIDCLGASSKM